MITSTVLFWLLLPAVVLFGVVLWVTETDAQRIRRWHQEGASQRAIADRMGISRYRVRQALA